MQLGLFAASERGSGSSNIMASYPGYELPPPTNPIRRPNPNDVLLGRGKPFQNWAGNQNMLTLIDAYRERYHEAERTAKHSIIETILSSIRSRGGRFLERHDNFETHCWVEVCHGTAYRKVGHAFRSSARKGSASLSLEARQAQIAAAHQAASSIAKMPHQLPPAPGPIPTHASLGMGMMMTPSSLSGISSSVLGLAPGGTTAAVAAAALDDRRRTLLAQEQIMHERRVNAILDSGAPLLPSSNAGSASVLASRRSSLIDDQLMSAGLMPQHASTLRPSTLLTESGLYGLNDASALRGGMGSTGVVGINSPLGRNRLPLASPSLAEESMLYRDMLSSMSGGIGRSVGLGGMGSLPLDRPGQNDAALVDMLLRRSESARAAAIAEDLRINQSPTAPKKLNAAMLKYAGGIKPK